MTGQEEYPRFISNRPCGNDKYEGKSQEEEENRMKPPVTYSHPKSVIVMIHMTGGTEMPFRSDGSSYAEATSEARSGVEKRAGFRFLVHRSFLILMGRRESAHPSGYGFLNYRSMGV